MPEFIMQVSLIILGILFLGYLGFIWLDYKKLDKKIKHKTHVTVLLVFSRIMLILSYVYGLLLIITLIFDGSNGYELYSFLRINGDLGIMPDSYQVLYLILLTLFVAMISLVFRALIKILNSFTGKALFGKKFILDIRLGLYALGVAYFLQMAVHVINQTTAFTFSEVAIYAISGIALSFISKIAIDNQESNE
ncbi:MAG: hypothetical protein AB7E61_00780 [Acholeplasmataceae bacterium]